MKGAPGKASLKGENKHNGCYARAGVVGGCTDCFADYDRAHPQSHGDEMLTTAHLVNHPPLHLVSKVTTGFDEENTVKNEAMI